MSFLCRVARGRVPQLVSNHLRSITSGVPRLQKKEIELTFICHDGSTIKTTGKVGDTFLNVIINNNLNVEGFGACEGTLTCSTCHLIFKKEDFDKIPNMPEDEEDDMLELARGVTDTSRLGCQVCLSESMDGIVVKVPEIIDIRLESEESSQ